MGASYDSKDLRSDRQELLVRLRDPKPEDVTLPAETDGYLRHHPEDAEIREARERLPELDQSEQPRALTSYELYAGQGERDGEGRIVQQIRPAASGFPRRLLSSN